MLNPLKRRKRRLIEQIRTQANDGNGIDERAASAAVRQARELSQLQADTLTVVFEMGENTSSSDLDTQEAFFQILNTPTLNQDQAFVVKTIAYAGRGGNGYHEGEAVTAVLNQPELGPNQADLLATLARSSSDSNDFDEGLAIAMVAKSPEFTSEKAAELRSVFFAARRNNWVDDLKEFGAILVD